MKNGHEHWTDQLSGYLDGELDAARRAPLEEHLAGCEACRAVAEDLRRIRNDARNLGDILPGRDLWPGIAAAMSSAPRGADVIALPVGDARTRRPAARSGVFLTVRQLAAAGIVLATMSAAATWWAGVGIAARSGAGTTFGVPDETVVFPVADAPGPSPELADELRVLEAAAAEARGRLDPNTLRILEKNLGVIQRAIDESLQALEVDPGNAFLREHLERAYREKADFLRDAAGFADWAS
jgi:hypothetical protein